jgi:predicted glycogen debranching enzyme
MTIDDRTEWLEADGLGGFASGTTSGIRTRRYHALLLSATQPPTGRMVLVNGFDAWLDTPGGTFALTTQRYAPDVLHPDGARYLRSFTNDPWPTWELELPDGTRLRQEIAVLHERAVTVIRWQRLDGAGPATLRVRPFFSGRDYHATHHENAAFRFDPVAQTDGTVVFSPYDGVPPVICCTNGTYSHRPDWYRQVLYTAERERGLDAVEDVASPGEFVWPLDSTGPPACWMLAAQQSDTGHDAGVDPRERAGAAFDTERCRRARFTDRLARAADAYLVRRREGRTIVAGYPWFTDWGRDTFIAVRGLCLATGRLAEARDILLEWAGTVSEGMLPNRFPDGGGEPEFNSVDASLWFVVAAGDLLQRDRRPSRLLTGARRGALHAAMARIVEGCARGTRFGIRLDVDGLLAAGVPGSQLTWMDARVGDREITPRIGKPVEVQALWLNAVAIAGSHDDRWMDVWRRGRAAFEACFWNETTGSLADVVDVDHVPGTRDDTCRPNQILAIGGLPRPLLRGTRARRIVDAVERRLLTPVGLRTLAPEAPGYTPHYDGGPSARDAAYHQGTVWPWLMGPFVDAWVRVRGGTAQARDEARARFMAPLVAHLDTAGLGHVSEIADAEPPFTPRGCPFQAWSLGELIRLQREIC